ncbi:hypothetical protein Dtox_2671 [Desulfofarcimen acetoxidans DSM 771]|uniref:Uncharacterized protein n=1 Tax=Desulfofarcimen acetoxidans (strain ATCC 49208 / DSM 771 / KCTC 5769 / VKM B-1644 / 5575) TaxID=485916 RepID=C8W157_DESAS|nr:hypothetical protein [Desulfofarcimen acetoxidans]ACV63453.1 hypothetical protein Dtox_2671 [Desulfofarcimen acetoxidans DSM 771]
MSEKHTVEMVLKKISELFDDIYQHSGYGEMRLEMRFLKKGQKEVIIHCGKQYRYVLDYPDRRPEKPEPGKSDVLEFPRRESH